jgi:hypothetical protein
MLESSDQTMEGGMRRRTFMWGAVLAICPGVAHAEPAGRGRGRRERDDVGTQIRAQISFSPRGGGGLPPGLQRNVERRGQLPPGLQRQYEQRGRLPPGLERRLSPLPPGYAYRVRGADVLIVSIRDGRVMDVVLNIVR